MTNFKKITEENYEEFSLGNYDDWLSDKIRTYLIGNSSDYQMELEYSLIDCESPIEQLLAIGLERANILNTIFYNPFIDVLAIEKQKQIKIKNKKYRVDFLIPVLYKNQGLIKFVIECDGYEFHQKTKKQVEEDNIRHRNLQEAGYEIIRFSGTEIWHKPYKCIEDIKNIILSKCKYIKDE